MKIIAHIYTAVFVVFCFFSYLFVDRNFIFLSAIYTGISTDYRALVSVVYLALISVLFILYAKILRYENLEALKKFRFLIVIPIVGILSYPAMLSFDLFNYLATAKVAFTYFENPYIVMPIEFINEPILIFTRATNKIALYGPLWTFLTSIPHYLSFGNYLLEIILIKSFVSAFFVGLVWLIWRIAKSWYAVIFFAASPLVLVETLVSGHNDVIMMFFALGSIYFLRSKKVWLALLFLLLSILIKYATIFLLPLFVYYFYQKVRNKEVDFEKIYFWGFILMLVIFFLSPLREEIYPWYAIWPMAFLALFAEKRKLLSSVFIFFTYCLMLRYIPYMETGNYFGYTPHIKLFITFILPAIFLGYLLLKNTRKAK